MLGVVPSVNILSSEPDFLLKVDSIYLPLCCSFFFFFFKRRVNEVLTGVFFFFFWKKQYLNFEMLLTHAQVNFHPTCCCDAGCPETAVEFARSKLAAAAAAAKKILITAYRRPIPGRSSDQIPLEMMGSKKLRSVARRRRFSVQNGPSFTFHQRGASYDVVKCRPPARWESIGITGETRRDATGGKKRLDENLIDPSRLNLATRLKKKTPA